MMDILETPRLLIRPFVPDDLEALYQLLDVDLQWAGPDRSIEWRKERLQFSIALAHWEDSGCLYGNRALILKSSGDLIGMAQFHPDLWTPRWKAIFWPQLFGPINAGEMENASLELGIGYALSSQCRGQGYASEAVRALLDHAFEVLKIKRVFAITDRANLASANLMRRVGMHTATNPDASVAYPAVAGVLHHRLAG